MTEGWFVYAQCRVQERKWSKENELEIKLVNVELLSEIKEKAIRSVCVNIELEDLTTDVINRIQALAEDNAGKHNLKIVVNDSSEGYAVSLRSKKFKISLVEDFINGLKQIPMLEIQIN